MLAITRFRSEAATDDTIQVELRDALGILGRQRGFIRGHVGRSVDDPGLWALVTEWEGVGAYRRALSSYDVKVHVVPVMFRAIDEPGAFELMESSS